MRLVDKETNPEKHGLRVLFFDENGKKVIKSDRDNENVTPNFQRGYEDLDMREDAVKISLYQNAEYIELGDDKTYKVVKKVFMPCRPVSLYLYLKEL